MLLVAAFASVDHYSVNITVKENLEKKLLELLILLNYPPRTRDGNYSRILTCLKQSNIVKGLNPGVISKVGWV